MERTGKRSPDLSPSDASTQPSLLGPRANEKAEAGIRRKAQCKNVSRLRASEAVKYEQVRLLSIIGYSAIRSM
jgi:hypothetical protein